MIKPSIAMAWLLVLVFSAGAIAAAPEARLDRTRIGEGETVLLSVTGPGGMGKPDLSALAQDFEILNSSQSMQMSMINGRSSSSQSWQFVLAPRRIGKIEVPAVTVDGVSTKPLSLEVLAAAEASKLGPGVPVSLEIEAEPERPYVQQKVIYTVRLLTRVPLNRVAISEPQVRDAMVVPLGAGREYSTQRGGQQYRVIERRYAIFPQRSGSLEIEGPMLSAQLPEQNQRGSGRGQRFPGRDPFTDFDRIFGRSGFPDFGSAFSQTRPIQLRGQTLVLDVQAQPAGTSSPWLPAESLSLNDSWSSDPPEFKVGEPVTRTIAITAQGLDAAQLPELAVEAPAGIKVYPDKPQAQSRADADTLISQKILKAALVPSRAGRFTLPEMQLAWWDTLNNQAQIARLPAREIEVLSAPVGSSQRPVDITPPVAAVPAFQPRSSATAPGRPVATVPEATSNNVPGNGPDEGLPGAGYWPWVAAVLGLAWLVTIGLWLRGRREKGVGPAVEAAPAAVPALNSRKLLTQVEQAFHANDPGSARRALLAWASANWPQDPPQRIDTLARRLGGDAVQALRELDQSLYSGASRPWDGKSAWEGISAALQKEAASRASRQQDSPLPPLYPKGA